MDKLSTAVKEPNFRVTFLSVIISPPEIKKLPKVIVKLFQNIAALIKTQAFT